MNSCILRRQHPRWRYVKTKLRIFERHRRVRSSRGQAVRCANHRPLRKSHQAAGKEPPPAAGQFGLRCGTVRYRVEGFSMDMIAKPEALQDIKIIDADTHIV